jgi:hypothetical protein
MFWSTDFGAVVPVCLPSAADAADLLENTLIKIEDDYRIAHSLGTSADIPSGMMFHFPKPPKDKRSGTIEIREWNGQKLVISCGMLADVEPQTFYWRTSGGDWQPAFHAQVESDIRESVAVLAKI